MLLGLDKIKKGSKLLIGLSGGVDSMSLLYALLEVREAFEFSLHAIYVNHNLREESRIEANALKKICALFDVIYHEKSIQVKQRAQIEKESIEAAAHTLRFEAFHEVIEKEKVDYLVLGHTRDDRAESFLINLLYGAGLNGLSPLPLFEGKIWRPFIALAKRNLFLYAEKKKITYFHDDSNDSPVYFRNRVRHEILPFLETYQPKIGKKIAHSAECLYESKMALKKVAEDYLQSNLVVKKQCVTLSKENLLKEPRGLIKMILLTLLNRYVPQARGLNEASWENLFTMLSKNETKKLLIKDNWWFESSKEWLSLRETALLDKAEKWEGKKLWTRDLILPLGKLEEVISDNSVCTCAFDCPIFIRFRKPGDKIYIEGLGHKSLKKCFQEKGIELPLREVWPIIINNENEILWIPKIYKNIKNKTIIKPMLVLEWSLGD